DVVELLENHYPGKEAGQAFQPDLQCLSFVPVSWRHQRGRLLGLLGWHDIGGHPRCPGTREWATPSAPPPIGCNLSTNYNRKRKPKWRRCGAASIAVGPSAILTGHGHGQAIGARMHGSAPWMTEETIVGLPRLLVLSVFSRSDSPDLVAVTFHLHETAAGPVWDR